MAIEFTEGRVVPIRVADEMRRSYIDYAMSVIVDRALPDVRDGLKPVQRRILYGMSELGIRPDRPHRKSARIVGDVMGKYHPHGDSAIYDAMVRMAQDFSFRYPLVDGHGNFGSVDGDPPGGNALHRGAPVADRHGDAAGHRQRDRRLHAQLRRIAAAARRACRPAFPNLLVNGAAGIAVGMATNIPPHNLTEVIDGLVKLIDNPEATIEELMTIIQGPDFPTGAQFWAGTASRRRTRPGGAASRCGARRGLSRWPTGASASSSPRCLTRSTRPT